MKAKKTIAKRHPATAEDPQLFGTLYLDQGEARVLQEFMHRAFTRELAESEHYADQNHPLYRATYALDNALSDIIGKP